MGIFCVVIILRGNFPGGNCPGGSYPGWEFSEWELSWELPSRNHLGGNFPGRSFPSTQIEMQSVLFTKRVFIWKPIYRPGHISTNRYNFFNALRTKSYNKGYNSADSLYERSFLANSRIWKRWTTQSILIKDLILLATIYHMHAVLKLLIIHGKQKIDNIILLLVKQNPLTYCQCQKILTPHLDCLPKLIS